MLGIGIGRTVQHWNRQADQQCRVRSIGHRGIKVDLVISKGGKKWILEIKQRDRKSFAETFASMEVWKKYKSVYGI